MGYLESLFNLEGKSALITGAAGMLCGEMAKGLARAGCQVMILDKNENQGQAIVQEINDLTRSKDRAFYAPLDAKSKKSFEEALTKALKNFKQVDIVINGAGINAPTPFMEITEKEWDDILAVHLKGTLFSCQVFGAEMLKNKKGSIINISSASSGPPLSKAFTYSVAKAGIKNLTQNLAREWGPHGVRVNALRPGFFPTEWSKKNFITPERQKSILDHTPMARFGEPQELLGAVLWLASDASGFVTGAEIEVDGGFSCMTI